MRHILEARLVIFWHEVSAILCTYLDIDPTSFASGSGLYFE